MPAVAMPRDRNSAPVARFVLPVSGLAVSLRAPTGAEEVLLAERRVEDADAGAGAGASGLAARMRTWTGRGSRSPTSTC